MERYDIIANLGVGSFGIVMLAIHKHCGQKVAIKQMKRSFPTWQVCTELRELKSLMRISYHDNIVQLHEVIRERDDKLYFVFEYMPDGNLYEFIKKYTAPVPSTRTSSAYLLTEYRIQSILKQLLQGIAHLHKYGYFHRDIKPENILCHGDRIKLADFGLARECKDSPETFTEYVSTRWYRAPEILLQSKHYGKPVDIFAVGCIAFELFTRVPLFPGEDEIDQLHKLCKVLGSPNSVTWPCGLDLASNIGFDFPHTPTKSVYASLERLIKKGPTKASSSAIQLMKDLLEWNPNQRPTVVESLVSAFLDTHLEDPLLAVDKGPSNSTISPWLKSTSSLTVATVSPESAAPTVQVPPVGGYSDLKRERDEAYFSPRSTFEYSTIGQHFGIPAYHVSPQMATMGTQFNPFSSSKKPRQLFSDGTILQL